LVRVLWTHVGGTIVYQRKGGPKKKKGFPEGGIRGFTDNVGSHFVEFMVKGKIGGKKGGKLNLNNRNMLTGTESIEFENTKGLLGNKGTEKNR